MENLVSLRKLFGVYTQAIEIKSIDEFGHGWAQAEGLSFLGNGSVKMCSSVHVQTGRIS